MALQISDWIQQAGRTKKRNQAAIPDSRSPVISACPLQRPNPNRLINMEICHNKNYNFASSSLCEKTAFAEQHWLNSNPFSGLWKVKCANRESLEIVFIVIFSLIWSASMADSFEIFLLCPYLISSNLARSHAFRLIDWPVFWASLFGLFWTVS